MLELPEIDDWLDGLVPWPGWVPCDCAPLLNPLELLLVAPAPGCVGRLELAPLWPEAAPPAADEGGVLWLELPGLDSKPLRELDWPLCVWPLAPALSVCVCAPLADRAEFVFEPLACPGVWKGRPGGGLSVSNARPGGVCAWPGAPIDRSLRLESSLRADAPAPRFRSCSCRLLEELVCCAITPVETERPTINATFLISIAFPFGEAPSALPEFKRLAD